MHNVNTRWVYPRMRIAGATLLVSAFVLGAMGGGIVGAAGTSSHGGSTNIFTVTGKHSGTLKLSYTTKNCTLTNGKGMPGLGGVSVEAILKGKLSGLSGTTWTFLSAAAKAGTVIEKGLTSKSTYGASLSAGSIPGSGVGFYANIRQDDLRRHHGLGRVQYDVQRRRESDVRG